MVRQGGIGVGGVVSEHGWLYENRDSRGGLEKALLVDGLRDRFDANTEQAEYAIEMTKMFNAVYEKGSKVYVNREE